MVSSQQHRLYSTSFSTKWQEHTTYYLCDCEDGCFVGFAHIIEGARKSTNYIVRHIRRYIRDKGHSTVRPRIIACFELKNLRGLGCKVCSKICVS